MSADLAKQVKQLQATLTKMQVTLDAIADAIVWIGEDGRLQWCNSSFERLVKQPYKSLLNSSFRDLLPLKQAGEPISLCSYPCRKIFRGNDEPTEYEFYQGEHLKVLQIVGYCMNFADEERIAVLTIRDVTWQKQLEAEFRQVVREREESLALLRTTLDSTADGIVFVDLEGNAPIYNKKLMQVWSLPESLLLSGRGQERLQYIAEQTKNPKAFIARIRELVLQHPETTALDIVELKDGRVFERYSQPQWQGNQIIGRVWSFRDVTKRIQAEQALRRNHTLLQASTEAGIDGILVIDENRQVALYNQRYWQIWQISEAILQAGDSRQLLEALLEKLEQPQDFLDKIEYLYNHPEEISHDEITLKDGRTLDRYSAPVRARQGEHYGRIWYFRDISDCKQAEAALRESEAKFRHIVENANDMIFVINPQGIITYMSPNVKNILGYEPAEVEGHYFPNFIHPNEVETCLERFARAQTGEKQLGSEYQCRHKDGSWHWLVANTSPFQDASDNLRFVCVARDITDHKQAEEALRQSELKFRTIVETANSILLRWDDKGNIKFLNEYGQRFFGYDISELQGRNVVGTIVPETETSGRDLQDLMDDICQHPENHILNENENIRKNGERVWIVWANKPILDERGNLVEILSVGTDTTERKRTEEALRRSELKYRNIFENSLVGIGRSRLEDGLFLDINQPCASIIGYSNVTELIGKRFAPEFQVDSDIRPWMLNQLQEYGEIRNLEIQLRRQDGSIAWGLMSARINVEDSCLEFIIVDISDRKRLEEERKKADAALQQRVQVESLLSRISRQFIDQDVKTAIIFTLEAVSQFIGAERTCIFEYTQQQSQLGLIHEWYAPGIQPLAMGATGGPVENFSIFSQILEGKAVVLSCVAELPSHTIEKALFENQSIQSVVAVPMIHRGSVVGFIGADVVSCSKNWSQEDINLLKLVGELIAIGRARHQVEEALRVAKDAAETANRAKSAFLANMSHELRTPLNAILGFAQLMERDTALTPKQRESLATINRSGEHLLNLINDVLEMSKIEAGRIVINPEPFDLHLLLQTLKEMFLLRVQTKQLLLKFEMAPDVPRYVRADRGKLCQVLINLLSNAVKFTQVGGVTLRVRAVNNSVLATSANQPALNNQQLTLFFEIEDTGRGIALEEMENLFQAFVQTSSGAQTKEGTGLGLTIGRQFVRLMGGDIRAQSTLGRGTTFRFNIQVTLAQAQEVVTPSTWGRVLKLAPNEPRYRILVVDDRQENRDLIAQLLSIVGFEVKCATNGQEAIALWRTWEPHLIWMDMRMPVMNGYEATQEIRERERGSRGGQNFRFPRKNARTIIIALTASAFEEQQASILAAGCDDLVRKPFREQIIFDKLAEHLGVRYLYAEEQESTEVQEQRSGELQQSVKFSDLGNIMSAEWMVQLHQAAIEVDGNRIAQLIAEIPETYSETAEVLMDLLRHFCFDEILNLVEGRMA